MGSGRRATPAGPQRQHEALAACVRRLVDESCNNGDLAALDAVLVPPAPRTRRPRTGGQSCRCGTTWRRSGMRYPMPAGRSWSRSPRGPRW